MIDSTAFPDIHFFPSKLLEWYAGSHRPLPWKGIRNAYQIWLSEIILQQTRVEQGLPYYNRFVERFPKVQDLAKAEEDEVLKLWEGLGYYSRARNMHAAAKYIVEQLQGQFPDAYEDILSLKGVGPYTAAAIASFAYDLPHAVVDGNVYRVLARFFGIDLPIDSTAAKKRFGSLAQQLLDEEDPARYNQAIMDFGATHCKPKKPLCDICLLNTRCKAFLTDRVTTLPIKSKRIQRRTRFFHYLILNQDADVWIQKRTEKDIWKNLYEFPMIEMDQSQRLVETVLQEASFFELLPQSAYEIQKISPAYQQLLTHQKIVAVFIELKLNKGLDLNSFGLKKIDRKNLSKFAFPKLIDCYLKDKSLYLNL